jgi:peptide/nickel transport system permease protein
MLTYITRRFFIALLTILAASVLSFIVMQLPPGDFATSYVALLQTQGTIVTTEEKEAIRQQYGLDRPMYVQYFRWLKQMAKGNFGLAFEYHRPVKEVIGDRLMLTMVVSVAAVFFIWALALPIGIYSAVRQYSIGDYVFTFIGFLGVAIPNFMLALIVMYVGFKYFGDNEIGGLFSQDYELAGWSLAKVWDLIKHLPLPALILGMAGTAELIRIMRANLLDELRKPYVVTARAKGLAETRVIIKYPVRAALNPFASTIGYIFPYIVSGSIIVSLVLSLPTVGPLLYKALIAQDLFLAGTILLMLSVLTVIGTFISDLVLMWIDPRIRFGLEGGR